MITLFNWAQCLSCGVALKSEEKAEGYCTHCNNQHKAEQSK